MSDVAIAPWRLARTAPGAFAAPEDVEAEWVAALVPGTVAAALAAAGRWTPDDAVGFDAFDHWYDTTLTGRGDAVLGLDGLATVAEVFLDGAPILHSDNMFLRHEVVLTLAGTHRLAIAFRSLDAWLAGRKGRARWRPRLVQPPALRFARTLLLGHIPGWGPPVHAVGPTRGVTLVPATWQRVCGTRIEARVEDGDGLLDLTVRLSAPVAGWVTARCGDVDFALVEQDDGSLRGQAELPEVALWWPHTHGEPALHPLTVYAGADALDLGAVGFRTLAVDRDADGHGFGLLVNGEPVFCRGACWTSADVVALPATRDALTPLLVLARDAGMNMIRVGGTMGYQGEAFHRLCDELGLLVWQDFAFANFDYPAGDPAFRASVEAEARQFLDRTQGSPSLAVLCGASEVAQQAAMLGMPAALWSNALFDTLLPEVVAALRPDVPYVAHSPSGGDLPFVADRGISHYYGVSAHRRPIEEARRAGVRFSAESLGLANVPDVAPFVLEADAPAIVHPDNGLRDPHDVAASWAFEGIRNHYAAALYGVDVAALRRDDRERFLHVARATSAEVMEATFAEWRCEGSPTRGALVWFLRDLHDGAGWGVIDARDAPKAAYHALKRAFRPVTVILTDENLNGLKLSLVNETAVARPVRLRLFCLRDGETVVMDAASDLTLAPRRTVALAATTVWGGFFDTTYAFRFGPPAHDVTVARLVDETSGALIAEAFHFPLGRGHARHDLGLAARVEHAADGVWRLALSTRRLAQSLHIRCEGARPRDNWFHLPPGATRIVDLVAEGARHHVAGTVTALNGIGTVTFGSHEGVSHGAP